MNPIQEAIFHIRNVIQIYERFANQPEWFIDEREHSIIISLTSFADTATKLNNSDNYKPTDEEQNYWNYTMSELFQFEDMLCNEIMVIYCDYNDIAIDCASCLYEEFHGRECENGEKLQCV
jgi:hypothetical protein